MPEAAPAAAAPATELIADQNDEIFDVVDDSNNPISTAARKRCHEEGLLHRSTHIFLFRSHRAMGATQSRLQVLLQRRSEHKKVGAGLWDVSVAEHLSAGEEYVEASVRGLREELGLRVDADALVKVRGPYLSKQFYEDAGVMDNMFTCAFAALYEVGHGRVVVDEGEVDCVEWWDVETVVRKAKTGSDTFTRWLLIELRAMDLVELAKRIVGEL